jgi:hypothetical protein
VRSGYNGRLQDVELLFRKGVDVYARNVFGSQLQPKVRQSVCTGHFFSACTPCKQRCKPMYALQRCSLQRADSEPKPIMYYVYVYYYYYSAWTDKL